MSARQAGLDVATALLVVVDVQQGFLNEASTPALPGIVRLLQGWSKAGGPYVLSSFYNPVESPYEVITGWTKLRAPEERAFASDLLPYVAGASAIVEKGKSSLFTAEGLSAIQSIDRHDLVFCGIDTDACVYDSATDAYSLGFRPWIVADACASSGGAQYHEAALLLARRNIGRPQVISVSEVLADLDGSMEAPA